MKLKIKNAKFKIIEFVFLTILILFGQIANAAERQVGLQEAIRLAFQNNHEILASGKALDASKEDIGIARSYLLPKITFEERFMRTNNATYAFMAKLNQGRFTIEDFAIDSLNNPKAVNDFQTSISFEQPLFVRKATIGLDMAKTEHSAKSEDHARKKEDIALKVARTYLMVRTAKEYVKVAEKAVEDAKEHKRIAEVRYKAGLGLYSDVLRASNAIADAEQKQVSTQKSLNIAKRALGLLLGMYESIDAAENFPEIVVMPLDYYASASLSRRDLKALDTRYENSKKNLKLADAGYYPMLGIGGSYQLNDESSPFGAEGKSWQVMAFLRWEIFDGAKREHERAKARHQTAETEEYLIQMKKAVSFKVYEAFLTVEEAGKNAELSRAALKTAEEGKRLVKVRYENALSPIVDLLDAQVSLDNARANLIARENELRAAITTLAYESGIILKDLKIEE